MINYASASGSVQANGRNLSRLCLFLTLFALLISACGDKRPLAEQLASHTEEGLAKVQTVEGRMDISTGPVTLQQKLWVQPPNFLRTETEEGPVQFKRTIVVLNDKDGWFYNPALRLVTVTDRSKYDPTLAAEAGTGSMLERLPTEILALLRTNPAIHEVGGEEIAGRDTTHIEIVINGQTKAFPDGLLQLWLDKEYGYPLAITTSSGLKIRFTMVEYNLVIDPLTFIFVPPPGALVQRVNPAKP
ncbi:hypothetical protein BH10CHL1_BH10CHL1_41430 [soil metagenome]